MTPSLILKAIVPIKKEVIVVFGVVTVITMMPVAMLLSNTNVAALNNPENKLYNGPVSTLNTYIFGYCTFWAAKRRAEVGKPIPNNWGDAYTWDDSARKDRYNVDHLPSVNAIMQIDNSGVGNLGHVAFVESVNADGSWKVSEMNAVGWDIMSSRTFGAGEAAKYNFIH